MTLLRKVCEADTPVTEESRLSNLPKAAQLVGGRAETMKPGGLML